MCSECTKIIINKSTFFYIKGRTYELGGPNVLSMLDIYEIMFNIMKFKPKLAYVNR